MVDDAPPGREERDLSHALGTQPGRGHGERDRLRRRRVAGGPRARRGNSPARRRDDRRRARVRRRARGDDGKRERDVRLLGNADLRADEPARARAQVQPSAGGKVRGRGEPGEHHHRVGIAEAHGRAHGDPLGMRPDEGTGRDPARQRPGDGHGLAGVAGIDPVRMPAGRDALTDTHPHGPAGLDARRLADQLDANPGARGLGRPFGGARGPIEETEREQGGEQREGPPRHAESYHVGEGAPDDGSVTRTRTGT